MKMPMIAIVSTLMFSCSAADVEAHPRHANHKTVVVERHVVTKPAPVRNVVNKLVVGAVVNALPVGHSRHVHLGRTYYFHDGHFYEPVARGYKVVRPVAGIRVSSLPRGHVTVRINGATHYRYRDVTYRRVNGYYVVV